MPFVPKFVSFWIIKEEILQIIIKKREEKDALIYWDQFRDSAKQREKIK